MPEDTTLTKPEETPSAAPEEQVKTKKTRKIALICAGAFVLLALMCVAGLSLHYDRAFLPATTAAGVNCTSLSPAKASAMVLTLAENETVIFRDLRGEDIAELPMTKLMDAAALEQEFAALLKDQHEGKGIFAWLSRGDYRYAPNLFAGLSEDTLRALLEEAVYGGTDPVAPQDAALLLEEDGYVLRPEVTGNLTDLDKCVSYSMKQLPGIPAVKTSEISIPNGRKLAAVTTESFALQRQMEQIDTYLSRQITIDFDNGSVYTLSPEELYAVSEIKLEAVNASCRPVREKILPLVTRLAEEYALDGVYAKFNHASETRELIYYRVGDDGWILDKEALADDVYAAILSGGDAAVTPRYDYTWYWKDYYYYYGVGDTFVEISLDNQYMWYYLDGELLVETPVVTGCVANWDETRRGCFCINYKVADVWLTGPTWHDHVDYWMPFDDQIGLHDSSWRSEYGGNIYLTDGSHGCVNTPLEAIRTIYENIWDGVPVIVY